MTKISKKSAYPIKNPIVGDYFVGTDSENNGKTVNFGFEYAVDLINRINGTLLINYKFVTDANIDLAVLTEGVFVSTANQTVISSVVQLKFNKKNLQEDDLNELFLFVKSNPLDFNIKLQNSANLINAVYFSISSVISYSDYFIFNVAIHKSNASLTDLVNLNIYFLNFEINSQGSVGTQGPQGEQGIQGIQGLKGDTGLQGIQGVQGVKGNDGAQGLKGDDGIQGFAGVQGLQGITGDTGVQGSKGDKGDTGTAGATQDISGKLDTGGFVGTAQDLNNRILDFELPDAILVQGIATLTGDTVSIAANAFTVRINQNVITNIGAYSTVIAPATTGFSRIDVIVANEAGSFEKVVGAEVADSIGIVPEPQILVNTLKVFFIQIDGAVIGNPKQISSDLYVTKAEYTFKKVNGSGNKAAVNVVDDSLSFRFPSADSISSISVNTNAQKYLYEGKRHLIKNDRASGTFTIFHNAGTGNFKYNFPAGLNLVLNVGEIAEFTLRFDVGNSGFFDFVGIKGSAGVTQFGTSLNQQIAVWHANGVIKGDPNFCYESGTLRLKQVNSSVDLWNGGDRFTMSSAGRQIYYYSPLNGGWTNTLQWQVPQTQQDHTVTIPHKTGMVALLNEITLQRAVENGAVVTRNNGRTIAQLASSNDENAFHQFKVGDDLGIYSAEVAINYTNAYMASTRAGITYANFVLGGGRWTALTEDIAAGIVQRFEGMVPLANTTIRLPNPTVAGTYVLATLADLATVQAQEPAQITITTTVSITTDTLGNLGKTQKEKNVIIDNGVNAINITVNGGTDFLASYLKHGTGAITFIQGTGRTLTLVDATAVLNGAVGSTATISSVGTKDYLRISNAV
jgi:hypothetical protein